MLNLTRINQHSTISIFSDALHRLCRITMCMSPSAPRTRSRMISDAAGVRRGLTLDIDAEGRSESTMGVTLEDAATPDSDAAGLWSGQISGGTDPIRNRSS